MAAETAASIASRFAARPTSGDCTPRTWNICGGAVPARLKRFRPGGLETADSWLFDAAFPGTATADIGRLSDEPCGSLGLPVGADMRGVSGSVFSEAAAIGAAGSGLGGGLRAKMAGGRTGAGAGVGNVGWSRTAIGGLVGIGGGVAARTFGSVPSGNGAGGDTGAELSPPPTGSRWFSAAPSAPLSERDPCDTPQLYRLRLKTSKPTWR